MNSMTNCTQFNPDQISVIVAWVREIRKFFDKVVEFVYENRELMGSMYSWSMLHQQNLESGESEMRLTPFHVGILAANTLFTQSQIAKRYSKAVREGWNAVSDSCTLLICQDGVDQKTEKPTFRVATFSVDCDTVRRALADLLLAPVTVCPPKKDKAVEKLAEKVAESVPVYASEPISRTPTEDEFLGEKEASADGIEKTPIDAPLGETGERHSDEPSEADRADMDGRTPESYTEGFPELDEPSRITPEPDAVNERTDTIPESELPKPKLLDSAESEARYASVKGEGVQRTYEEIPYEHSPGIALHWRIWCDAEVMDEFVSEVYDIPHDDFTTPQAK